jgi:hypothetical protein
MPLFSDDAAALLLYSETAGLAKCGSTAANISQQVPARQLTRAPLPAS